MFPGLFGFSNMPSPFYLGIPWRPYIQTLKALYCGAHFRYCCSVWGCCASMAINHQQILQNRAARIIINSNFDGPGTRLIRELEWKTIEELKGYETKTMVFKNLHKLAPEYLCNLSNRTLSKLTFTFLHS